MHSYVHGLAIDEHRIDMQLQSQSQTIANAAVVAAATTTAIIYETNVPQNDLNLFSSTLNGNASMLQTSSSSPEQTANHEIYDNVNSLNNQSDNLTAPVASKAYTKLSRASTLPEDSTLCSLCNKLFSAERYFKQHYNSVHLHNGPKRYKCMLCQRSFYTEKALQKHVDHEMQKTHNCSECERTFHRKPDLIRHSFVHRKTKPFTCSTCQKSFIRADQLTYHQRNCAPSTLLTNKSVQKPSDWCAAERSDQTECRMGRWGYNPLSILRLCHSREFPLWPKKKKTYWGAVSD